MIVQYPNDPSLPLQVPLDHRALIYVEEELLATGLTLAAYLLKRRADWGRAWTYRARTDPMEGLYQFPYGRRAPAVLNDVALAAMWHQFKEDGISEEREEGKESRCLVFEDVMTNASDLWPDEDRYACICLGEEVYNVISDDLPADLGDLSRRINLNWAPGGAGAFVRTQPTAALSKRGTTVPESYIATLANDAVALMVWAYDGEGIILVDLEPR